MYSIFFHVSGIALIEIFFYFYYIGPMETVIFQNRVEKIVNEPLHNIDDSQRNTIIESDYFQLFFNQGTTNQTSVTKLVNDKNNGKKQRMEKNEHLFTEIIIYWSIFFGFSLFVFLLEYLFKKKYTMRKENSTSNIILANREIEMEALPLQLSRSEQNLEATIYCTEKRKKYSYKFFYYLFFACCILGFQYFFFQYIVLKYDPLSIEETKYILYTNLEKELDQVN